MTTITKCQCRWCQQPVELTSDDEKYRDQLNDRVDRLGYESLTEDQQALVLFGPLCEPCEKQAK